jgi:hypothetical protein
LALGGVEQHRGRGVPGRSIRRPASRTTTSFIYKRRIEGKGNAKRRGRLALRVPDVALQWTRRRGDRPRLAAVGEPTSRPWRPRRREHAIRGRIPPRPRPSRNGLC